MPDIKTIADMADIIINGYAFVLIGDRYLSCFQFGAYVP